MGFKQLELTIVSAKDLKDVNLIGKMDVYVVVSLSGESKSKQKTPVHTDGGTCPSWNHNMKFTVDESAAQHGTNLIFQLRHESTFGDKDLGEVRVPVRELFDSFHGKKDPQFVTYQVKRPAGRPKGELKFSFKVSNMANPSGKMGCGEKTSAPVGAYPPQACSSSSSYYPPAGGAYPPSTAAPYPPTKAAPYPPSAAGQYPPATAAPYPPPAGYPPPPADGYPQQPPAGYPQQPPAGYPQQPAGYRAAPSQGYPPQGYPSQQYGVYPPQPAGGYGYPPQAGYQQMQQPQKPKKSSKLGMGLGAGLLGGAVGGLILGDMVSDSFDDCGDF